MMMSLLSSFDASQAMTKASYTSHNVIPKCLHVSTRAKREEAWDRAKKHGVQVLSAWASVLDHLVFYVVEASSQEDVEDYFRDIGFAFWNSIEI
jgi:hypothetical protein